MTVLAHALAALAYAAGVVLDGRSREGASLRPSAWALAIGALVHTGAFVSVHAETPPVPLESVASALSLIGWLLALSYLLSLRVARVRELGSVVSAAAALVTLAAAVALALHTRPPSADGGAWSHAHVLVSAFGFSLLGLSSLAGLGYLLKQRALKGKRRGLRLPSLESLDRVEHLTLGVGFGLLTLGMLTGFAWSARAGLAAWTGHSLFLIVAWAIYLAPIRLRLLRGQHGDRPARFVVAGFVVLAFSYFGVRIFGGIA